MRKELRRRGLRMLLVTTAVLAGASGIALATIPRSDGVVSGCYEKRTGILRVIDAEAGKSCLGFETAISWNQGGPKGPIGDKGPTGDRGPTGAKGPQGDAGPGVEGLVGYERVSFTSPSDSFWYKGYAAACPRGKHVIAGGYRTSGIDAFHVDGSFPEDVSWTDAAGAYVAEAWRVLVRDPQARTDRNWGVTVWAVCAK